MNSATGAVMVKTAITNSSIREYDLTIQVYYTVLKDDTIIFMN